MRRSARPYRAREWNPALLRAGRIAYWLIVVALVLRGLNALYEVDRVGNAVFTFVFLIVLGCGIAMANGHDTRETEARQQAEREGFERGWEAGQSAAGREPSDVGG